MEVVLVKGYLWNFSVIVIIILLIHSQGTYEDNKHVPKCLVILFEGNIIWVHTCILSIFIFTSVAVSYSGHILHNTSILVIWLKFQCF